MDPPSSSISMDGGWGRWIFSFLGLDVAGEKKEGKGEEDGVVLMKCQIVCVCLTIDTTVIHYHLSNSLKILANSSSALGSYQLMGITIGMIVIFNDNGNSIELLLFGSKSIISIIVIGDAWFHPTFVMRIS